MQNHFKRWLIIGISSILLSGCGVLFATGDWFNADYPSFDETWVHPQLAQVEAREVRINCANMAAKKILGIDKYNDMPIDEINRILTHTPSEKEFKFNALREQCYLDNGFKFYPRGIKRNHPTVCFGESKKLPGCQSVFDISIL